MHCNEGTLESKANPILKKIHNFIKNKSFDVSGEKTIIPTYTEMWNAGVIGLNSNQSYLLPKILKITDLLYASYPKHVMEQLAFSYYIQSRGAINSAQESIVHYWDMKEFSTDILNYIETNRGNDLKDMVKTIYSISPKKKSKKLNFIQRFFNKLQKKIPRKPRDL